MAAIASAEAEEAAGEEAAEECDGERVLTEAAGVGDLEDDFFATVLDGDGGAIDEKGESDEEDDGTDLVRPAAIAPAAPQLTRAPR